MFQMPLTVSKVDCIFQEPLNLFMGQIIQLFISNTFDRWLAFLLSHNGFQWTIEPTWRNYLIWTADWCGEYSTPYIEHTRYFLFSNCSNVSDFLNWRQFWFYFSLEEFIKLQTQKADKRANNYFLKPINCTSMVQIKHFK